jgi:hypothetical protein
MNMKRNIRIAAIVAMANGVIALWLLPPGVAQADTCSAARGIYCDLNNLCPIAGPAAACQQFAPQGCVEVIHKCLNISCGPPPYYPGSEVYCTYTAG